MIDLSVEYPWMKVARSKLGIEEIPGARANMDIVAMLQSTTVPAAMAKTDATPWCAAFVNKVLKEAGIRTINSARAKDWLNWGAPPEGDQDWKPGVVVVMSRQGGGHVGFLVDWDDDAETVTVLGGNQGNRVCIATFSMNNVIGYRIPA